MQSVTEQFPLVGFTKFLQNRALSVVSILLYTNMVRRTLNRCGLDTTPAMLNSFKNELVPAMQIRLSVAWKHFVNYAAIGGRVVAELPEATAAVDYPDLRRLLPPFLTATKLKPKQLPRLRIGDITIEEHKDGVFWIFNAWHGGKLGSIRHPVAHDVIKPIADPIMHWGHPYWRGDTGLDIARPFLPCAPGSTAPMSARVIELICQSDLARARPAL